MIKEASGHVIEGYNNNDEPRRDPKAINQAQSYLGGITLISAGFYRE